MINLQIGRRAIETPLSLVAVNLDLNWIDGCPNVSIKDSFPTAEFRNKKSINVSFHINTVQQLLTLIPQILSSLSNTSSRPSSTAAVAVYECCIINLYDSQYRHENPPSHWHPLRVIRELLHPRQYRKIFKPVPGQIIFLSRSYGFRNGYIHCYIRHSQQSDSEISSKVIVSGPIGRCTMGWSPTTVRLLKSPVYRLRAQLNRSHRLSSGR